MKKSIFLIIAMLAATLWAQNNEAVITYLEGTVDISRNGEYLDWGDVDIGTVIENYDLLETGFDGYVEIEVSTPVSPAVIVKIEPDTTFYYDTKQVQGNTKTSFQLLTGSIGMKVQRLYNDSELDININNSVMGVRGTEFKVSSTVDGATLVTTKEGRVSCKNESGKEWYSYPGVICESSEEGGYKEIPLPVDQIDAYEQKWIEDRLNILRSNLKISLNHYTEIYNQYYPKFDRIWGNLESKDDVFAKWNRYIRQGVQPSLSEAVLAKQAISREIIELRSVLPIFQQGFYVLKELGKAYKEGYGQDISRPRKQLMDHFFNNYRDTRQKLTKTLYYFRIYLEMTKRISGSDYAPEGLLDITSGSNMLMGPPVPNSPF